MLPVHLLDLSFVYSFHRTDIVDSCYVIVALQILPFPMVVVALTGSKPLLWWWCGEECFSVGFHIEFTILFFAQHTSVHCIADVSFPSAHHTLFYDAFTVFSGFSTRTIWMLPSSVFIRVLLFWIPSPPCIKCSNTQIKRYGFGVFFLLALRYNFSFHNKIMVLAMFRIPVQTSSQKVQAKLKHLRALSLR